MQSKQRVDGSMGQMGQFFLDGSYGSCAQLFLSTGLESGVLKFNLLPLISLSTQIYSSKRQTQSNKRQTHKNCSITAPCVRLIR